jgi:hypothetical protein
MNAVWKVLCLVIILVLCFSISYWLFNAVVNSDISPFWKWMLLRG